VLRQARFLLLLIAATSALAQPTAKNDDSCDLSLQPAATLLLPYFEVDFRSPRERARTTFFSVTNTTPMPQIAAVTVWSDWAFPVLTFSIFLTGYDVQAINLYDVIAEGRIAPAAGTSNATTPGSRSLSNLSGNPNFHPTAIANCSPIAMPDVPSFLREDVRTGLSTGAYSLCGNTRIGGTHDNAIGYVTIDVASTCYPALPTQREYLETVLLFDNVLTGDYQILEPHTSFADGGPMVHIRAVPEGGHWGSRIETNLPHTFYDRYTPRDARKMDRRQPLPSVFAVRYVQGSAFSTSLRIWREGVTGAEAQCSAYAENGPRGMRITDLVRFDERENSWAPYAPWVITGWVPPMFYPPATSVVPAQVPYAHPLPPGEAGGWMYVNLDNGARYAPANPYSTTRASQNWITVSMVTAAGHDLSFDATALVNGCSPPVDSGKTPEPRP
jgi:hypothetical protein